MRQESLDALGAVPVIIRFEEARERLPEIIGGAARIVVDNPKAFLLLGSLDYVISGAVLNLVKPRGLLGIMACGVVSVSLATTAAAELMKRGIIEIKVRDDQGCLVPLYGGDDDAS